MPYYNGFGLYDESPLTPPQTDRADLLHMIDMAMDTKDEQWFAELTERLKNME
ncbi:IDEAL domain-containing protein [Peribacillus muralis]|uniref:IDEAL domain-containing protein n=1 Tax=Peribacillus muralis TaxID=264697 RepID=UPI003CFBC376